MSVNESSITPQDYESFRVFLEKACGILLGENKHYLVTSRLNRLMREFQVASFADLMRILREQPRSPLREQIIDAMTTNETMWFRDTYPFEMLRLTILPELAKQPRSGPLRIWSAACSTGQEPYSISMTVSEFQQANPGALRGDVQIIATDISPSALRIARAGVYERITVVRGLSEERRNRFFLDHGERWEVKPEIRRRVSFSEGNLMSSYAALGRFDIIFCRNVLIYFSADLKRDILGRMAQSLNPNGYLFLGGSESPTSYSPAYQMVRTPQGVVYRLRDHG